MTPAEPSSAAPPARPSPPGSVVVTSPGSRSISSRSGAISAGCDSALSATSTPPARSTRTGCGHQAGYSVRSASRNSRSTAPSASSASAAPPSATRNSTYSASPASASAAPRVVLGGRVGVQAEHPAAGGAGGVGQPERRHPARRADLDDRAGPDGLGQEPEQPAGIGLQHPPPVEAVGLGGVVPLRGREQLLDGRAHPLVHAADPDTPRRCSDRVTATSYSTDRICSITLSVTPPGVDPILRGLRWAYARSPATSRTVLLAGYWLWVVFSTVPQLRRGARDQRIRTQVLLIKTAAVGAHRAGGRRDPLLGDALVAGGIAACRSRPGSGVLLHRAYRRLVAPPAPGPLTRRARSSAGGGWSRQPVVQRRSTTVPSPGRPRRTRDAGGAGHAEPASAREARPAAPVSCR